MQALTNNFLATFEGKASLKSGALPEQKIEQ